MTLRTKMMERLISFLLLLAVVGYSNCLPQIQPVTSQNSPTDGCVCVPFYNCRDGVIGTDGVDVLEERDGENRDVCNAAYEVCCKEPTDDEVTVPILQPEPAQAPAEIQKPQMKSMGGCGYRNEQTIGNKIVNFDNSTTEFGEFPWMIGVLELENGQAAPVYKCGGSLIHPQVVLTAAHCFKDKNAQNIFARAGEYNSQKTDEPLPHQEIKVKSIIKHEKFIPKSLHNDIALLVLEKPFNLAGNVDIICLPQNSKDISRSKDCLATGWGREFNYVMAPLHATLRKIDLPMVPNDQCQIRLRETRLGAYFRLNKSFVCAGGVKNIDTCKGDGGSPLVCPVPNQTGRYFQTGIVAGGIDCGTGVPSLYANVAYFRDWIDSNMRTFKLETQYNYI